MRHRLGSLESFLGAAMRLPPTLTVVLSVVLYLGCHLLARLEPRQPSDIHGLTIYALEHYVLTLAATLQYILPLLFLVAAAGSYFQRGASRR